MGEKKLTAAEWNACMVEDDEALRSMASKVVDRDKEIAAKDAEIERLTRERDELRRIVGLKDQVCRVDVRSLLAPEHAPEEPVTDPYDLHRVAHEVAIALWSINQSMLKGLLEIERLMSQGLHSDHRKAALKIARALLDKEAEDGIGDGSHLLPGHEQSERRR